MIPDLSNGLAALLAGVLSAGAIPLLMRLARRTGFVDRPAAHKHHHAPRPLLGGVALVVGAFLPAWLAPAAGAVLLPLSGGVAVLFVAGLVDDRRGLGVRAKLALQVLAAILVMTGGHRLPLPFEAPAWATALVTLLWLVGVTNALNLLDNVDGLAASVSAAVALGLLAVGGVAGPSAPLAAGLFGASLGFLVFNWPPARIFMGDAGSLPLGLTLAVLAMTVASQAGMHGPVWLLPWLLLAVPVLDTTTVVLSRLARGRNPLTTPGVDHLSHRLIRRGLAVPAAVAVLVGFSLLMGAVAYGMAGAPFSEATP